MADPARTLFRRLPYPLKVVVASVRGWQLGRWRYGPETDVLVAEATDREGWDSSRWGVWKEEFLHRQLKNARFRVRWYRSWWESHGSQLPEDAWEDLANWPILTKEEVRQDPSVFVRDDVPRNRVFHFRTSGSTGTPLDLWISKENLRRWYALFEARWRQWNGIGRCDRWAIVGGQMVVPVDRKKPPFWVWNQGMQQLYVSAYHIASWSAEAILAAMKQHRVRYLYGYSSAMAALAAMGLERDLDAPHLKVVLSNAEPLLPDQRVILREFFDCPVVNTYGMSEMVTGASECECGQMHLWPEAGHLEILDADDLTSVEHGKVGTFVCTGLVNTEMPLIRYQVGDRGAIGKPGATCSCGRNLPILDLIEGRLDDVVITPDGRKIGRLDTAFKADFPIRRAQIVQDEVHRLTIMVLPGENYSSHTRVKLIQALRERVGEMNIEVVEVAELPLGPNGKFRAVISHVTG